MVSLFLFALIIFTPGAARNWYQIGTGLYYDKELTIAGLTHEQSMASSTHSLRVEAAKRNGTIYSALMVNSTYIPLFFYLMLTIIIATTPLSQPVNKKLFALFPAFLIWGISFSSLSHIMISSMPKMNAFLGASVIWISLTGIFIVVVFIVLLSRRALIKRNTSIINQ